MYSVVVVESLIAGTGNQRVRMRKCCCCGLKTGTIILGVVNFVAALLVLIPLAGYLSESDLDGLNVLKKNDKYMEIVLEDILKEHNWTMHNYDDIMEKVREYWPTAALTATILLGISASAALFLVIGVKCGVRWMLVPYLALTMVDIIVAGSGGIIIVVALFWSNIVPGLVSLVVYLVVAVLTLYSWAAVLATYRLISNPGYNYSPAPVKPAYGTDYYPSAPQHFVMEEYRDRKEFR